jgi:glycosyltransferase involved in cell wall biosynthesis
MSAGWETINGVQVQRFAVNSQMSQFFVFHRVLLSGLGINTRAAFGGPIVPGLGRAIQEFACDVIAAASFPLLTCHRHDAKRSKRPAVLIGGLHPQDEWGFQRPMIYRAIQQADAYIAFTDFEARYVQSRQKQLAHVFVTGIGVDLERFRGIATADAKRRLGIEDKPTIGFVGQLGKFKGVRTLLQAMPIVWTAIPDAQLLIAGGRTLFAEELERTISEFRETNRRKIKFMLNFKEEDKPVLFAALDALVIHPDSSLWYRLFGGVGIWETGHRAQGRDSMGD